MTGPREPIAASLYPNALDARLSSRPKWRDLLFPSSTSQSSLGAPPSRLSSRPEGTRISCHAPRDKTTCASFGKEGRMKCTNATKFHRKSGVAQWRDLRFRGPFLGMFSTGATTGPAGSPKKWT